MGYRILARNWRVRRYEIDLIVERDTVVAFVEVKTRTDGLESAGLALAASQRRRIRRAAEAWIHAHPGIGREFRFDLVTVEPRPGRAPKLRHVKDAFFGEEAR